MIARIFMLAACLLAAPAFAAPRFVERAALLGIEHLYAGGWAHFVGGGVAIFDCDNDGLLDLFAAGGENPAGLFRNISTPGGEIDYERADIAPFTGVTGAYPLDIDADGLMDLMVLRNGPNILLRGLGDCAFEAANAAFNLPAGDAWSTAFAALWEPGQSLPTLAIGNYVDASDPDGPFEACDTNWLIRPIGRLYDAPTALEPGFCPLSMLFSDWRRKGAPMLRLSNDRQYYVRGGYEQMWMLDPLRELTEEDGWGRLQLWGMGVASRDISGDGLPEIMLTSMGDQMLMLNDGAGFRTAPFDIGAFAQRPFMGDDGRPSTGWHAEFGDIDNDGRADLFIAKGNVDQMPGMAMKDPNNLLMQQPDGTFRERADVAGVATTHRARGAGLADLNLDGLLDLIVINRRAPMEIWRNATPDAGNWLMLDLRQPGGNINAVGAIVELRAGGALQTIERTVGGGHVSGAAAPLHFGLGAAMAAEIRVIWPDGSQTAWMPARANQRMLIEKDSGVGDGQPAGH